MRCASFYLWWFCFLGLVVGRLEPIIENVPKEDYQTVTSVMSILDSNENFINFIIYRGDQSQRQQSFPKIVMETFKRAVILAALDTAATQNTISSLNLAVVFFTDITDSTLRIVEKSHGKFKETHIIFVYTASDGQHPSNQFVEYFFTWCANNRLYNAKLIVDSSIWTYILTNKVEIIKVTLEMLSKWREEMQKYVGNMESSRSVVPFYHDPPYVFGVKGKDGQVKLGGPAGQLVRALMIYVNSTFDALPVSIDEYFKITRTGHMHNRDVIFGVNREVGLTFNSDFSSIILTRTCLLLPDKRLNSFDGIWTHDKFQTLLFNVFYLVVHTLIKCISNSHHSPYDMIFEVFRASAGQPSTSYYLRLQTLPENCLSLSMQIYIAVYFNLFISVLTTRMVSNVHMPQIVDKESFLASGLKIMVYPDQLHIFFDSFPKSLNSRITIVSKQIWLEHFTTLDNTFAYLMSAEKRVGLQLMQERLLHPKLRIAPNKLCGVPRYVRFYVRPDVYILGKVSQFFTQAFETGLWFRWERVGHFQAKQMHFLNRTIEDHTKFHAMPLEFISLSFVRIFALFIGVSIIVFVLEWIYFFMQRKLRVANIV